MVNGYVLICSHIFNGDFPFTFRLSLQTLNLLHPLCFLSLHVGVFGQFALVVLDFQADLANFWSVECRKQLFHSWWIQQGVDPCGLCVCVPVCVCGLYRLAPFCPTLLPFTLMCLLHLQLHTKINTPTTMLCWTEWLFLSCACSFKDCILYHHTLWFATDIFIYLYLM